MIYKVIHTIRVFNEYQGIKYERNDIRNHALYKYPANHLSAEK